MPISQEKLALLETLDLQLIEGTELFKRRDRRIKIAMLNVEPVQLRFQRLTFFVGHMNPHLSPRNPTNFETTQILSEFACRASCHHTMEVVNPTLTALSTGECLAPNNLFLRLQM